MLVAAGLVRQHVKLLASLLVAKLLALVQLLLRALVVLGLM